TQRCRSGRACGRRRTRALACMRADRPSPPCAWARGSPPAAARRSEALAVVATPAVGRRAAAVARVAALVVVLVLDVAHVADQEHDVPDPRQQQGPFVPGVG